MAGKRTQEDLPRRRAETMSSASPSGSPVAAQRGHRRSSLLGNMAVAGRAVLFHHLGKVVGAVAVGG